MDKNENLIDKLRRKKYSAAFTLNNKYIFQDVNVNSVFHISDSFDINNFQLVFICVGLREYLSLSEVIKNFKGTCFVLENDELSSQNLRDLTGKKNIFFGIPDVISSNTAPKHLLDLDPLTTVSETGDLVLEKSKFNFQKKILVPNKKKFYEHWICKLFIHNL